MIRLGRNQHEEPQVHPHGDERLVAIGTAPNEIVASLWRGMLEEAGIRSMAKPLGPGAAYFTTTIVPHKVYVLESDAERAKELLAEAE